MCALQVIAAVLRTVLLIRDTNHFESDILTEVTMAITPARRMSARPIPAGRDTAQSAAKASWIAVLVPIPVRLVLQSSVSDAGANAWMLNMVSVAVTVGCCVIGLAAGLYALSRVGSVGREGVLTPAVIGTVLNALFLCIMVLAFLGRLS